MQLQKIKRRDPLNLIRGCFFYLRVLSAEPFSGAFRIGVGVILSGDVMKAGIQRRHPTGFIKAYRFVDCLTIVQSRASAADILRERAPRTFEFLAQFGIGRRGCKDRKRPINLIGIIAPQQLQKPLLPQELYLSY